MVLRSAERQMEQTFVIQKGSVEGIPAADGYACGTQLELAALYGYIILRTVGGEFLQFYYTLSDQPGLYADRYDDPYVTGLLLPATVLDTQAEQTQSIDLIKFAKKWIWAFKYSNG